MAYGLLRGVGAGLLACLSIACGDGGSGDDEEPPVSDNCFVRGELSGGLAHSFVVGGSAFTCSGSGASANAGQLLGKGDALFTGPRIAVDLDGLEPVPALNQKGVAMVSRVRLVSEGAQATDSNQPRDSAVWEFPAGACVVDVLGTVKDADFDWVWFRGAIECSGSATAVAPNTKAPVTLSNVVVNTFIAARP